MAARLLVGVSALVASAPLLGAVVDQPMQCPLVGAYDRHNPFVAILKGEKSQTVIYVDPLVMAFVPISWDSPGHVLVVPRRAVRNINDMTDAEILAVFHLIRRIGVAQQRAFGSAGFSVEQNNARNQTVCHAHFHVIPNNPKEPVQHATIAQMQAIAAKLRGALPPF